MSEDRRFSYYSMLPWPPKRCSLDYVFTIGYPLRWLVYSLYTFTIFRFSSALSHRIFTELASIYAALSLPRTHNASLLRVPISPLPHMAHLVGLEPTTPRLLYHIAFTLWSGLCLHHSFPQVFRVKSLHTEGYQLNNLSQSEHHNFGCSLDFHI